MRYAIYGCGQYGEAFFEALAQQEISPDYFIDQYTNKETFLSKPVFRAEQITDSSSAVAATACKEDISSASFISLDDQLLFASPNFIKLDIEGAELEALSGAKELLTKRPVLAICLYHRPADLWEIPLFIHKINPS